MANRNDCATDRDLSKLATDVIPLNVMRPFALQYLTLNDSEYKAIVSSGHNSHDTAVECLKIWRDRPGSSGSRDTMFQLLEAAREEHGWFEKQSYTFLQDINGIYPIVNHQSKSFVVRIKDGQFRFRNRNRFHRF